MKNTLILSALAILPAFAGSDGHYNSPLEFSTDNSEHQSYSGHDHDRPDAIGPIGVMSSHLMEEGKWMATYRYMFMRMEQNYNDDSQVSDSSIISPSGDNFLVTPTNMNMQMHMFGLMYGATDKLTLMGMLSLVDLSMDHVTRSGDTFRTESSGLGDSSVGALYEIFQTSNHRAHIGLMVLLPSADIDNGDDTPLGFSRLPYPMQLGSGSWGVSPSITWTGFSQDWSFGAQLSGRFFLSDNENDYTLGNQYNGTLWGARRWSDSFSTSLRVSVSRWDNIDGADPDIRTVAAPMGVPVSLVPTAETNLRAGTRVDLSIGANIRIPKTGATLALEAGIPVYQYLDGPQLGVDWMTTAGIRYEF